jgi:capsular polysaccharide biosynthesis protein
MSAPLLRKQSWAIIAVCGLIGALAAFIHASNTQASYSSTAELLFGSNSSLLQLLGVPNTNPSSDSTGSAQATNASLVALPVISTRTSQALGSRTPKGFTVATSTAGSSNLVNVTATASTPAGAALVANTYSHQFLAYTLQSQQAEVGQAILALKRTLRALDPHAQQTTQAANLQGTLAQLETISATNPIGVGIVQPAVPPTSPSGPHKGREAGLGLAIGLVIGAIVAILANLIDPRLHTVDALGRNITVLSLSDGGPNPDGARATGYPERSAVKLLRSLRHQRSGTKERFACGFVATDDDAAGRQLCARVAAQVAQAAADAGLRVGLLDLSMPGDRNDESNTPDNPTRDLGDLVAIRASAAGVQQHNGAHTFDVLRPGALAFADYDALARAVHTAMDNYEFLALDTAALADAEVIDEFFGRADGMVVISRLHHSRRDRTEGWLDRLLSRQDNVVLVAAS